AFDQFRTGFVVLSWRNEFLPTLREEGYSRMTYELEPAGESVKLIVIHEVVLHHQKLPTGLVP
ncbi:MAG TPA: hypothetical protein VGL71_06815, partial [Urbifossiella sp.]